jgi:DNA recombination protein RmuC
LLQQLVASDVKARLRMEIGLQEAEGGDVDYQQVVLAFALGIVLGFVIAYVFRGVQLKALRESERSTQAILDQMKESFGSLSVDALNKVSGEVIKIAQLTLKDQQTASAGDLQGKKALIDQELVAINGQLEAVQKLMNGLEADRERKFGELAAELKSATQQTSVLTETTGALREVLASTRARGQWGERMADDVLRAAGFKEGVNYDRQTVQEANRNRPDFSFLLPQGLVLNMDVKFPLENYVKAIEAKTPEDAQTHASRFIADVHARVKEITTRDYIDEENGTVSCVLLFVPIESVLAFAQEQDSGLIDYALALRVVLCSPSSLFAVLAIIRQAVDTFAVEKKSKEILAALAAFRKQWDKYNDEFKKLGKHLQQTQDDYTALDGTRARQLQRQLDEVDRLRELDGIPLPPTPEDTTGEAGNGDSTVDLFRGPDDLQ